MTKPTKLLCAQRRLRSAWASAQSDQSLRCPHEESLGPSLPTERKAKTLIRLGGCSLLLLWFINISRLYMSRLMTKQTKWHVRPAKTQISLGIRPVWSESSLSAWRKLGSFATHWAQSEDSDQTGRMPRLIWVFAGRTVTLLVLSCRGSYRVFFFFCAICSRSLETVQLEHILLAEPSVAGQQTFWNARKTLQIVNLLSFFPVVDSCFPLNPGYTDNATAVRPHWACTKDWPPLI